jgi:ketosteroid isomerase-like protein
MSELEKLFRDYLALGTTDMEAFLGLMHDEIVIEFPYGTSAGLKPRLAGRDEIRQGLSGFLASVPSLRFLDVVVHQTADPDQAFAIYRADATVLSTGKPYRQDYVAQLRRRDGKVVYFREWFDPVRLLTAFQ